MDRRSGASLVHLLGWTTLLGLAVWVVAGGVYSWLFVRAQFGSETSYRTLRVLYVVESVGFRLWVGSMALLAVIWLKRSLGAQKGRAP